VIPIGGRRILLVRVVRLLLLLRGLLHRLVHGIWGALRGCHHGLVGA